MPIVSSAYRAPWYFKNGHISTIYPNLFRRIPVDYRRERWFTPDDDFLDIDWVTVGAKKLVILLHGLEGSTDSQYMRGSSRYFSDRGWDVFALNFRSCGDEINRSLHMYHHGDYDDLHFVLGRITKEYSYERIILVGFSLGGNVLLKYLGQLNRDIPDLVKGGIAVSVPCDLHSSSSALDEFHNILYTLRFRNELKVKLREKEKQYPQVIDTSKWKEVRKWRDFDNLFTCSIYPFENAEEYYDQGSANNFIGDIVHPCLIINAINDPFLKQPSYPDDIASRKANIFLEMPKYGGHVGFLQSQVISSYAEERALRFVQERLGG